MEAARPKPKPNVAGRAERAEEAESLVDFCARPTCRTEFRRTIGPGRKQAYCSEMCRRQAERELRQKRISLAHFERVVEMLRVDIAAFGKTDFDTADNEGQSSTFDERQKMRYAGRPVLLPSQILMSQPCESFRGYTTRSLLLFYLGTNRSVSVHHRQDVVEEWTG